MQFQTVCDGEITSYEGSALAIKILDAVDLEEGANSDVFQAVLDVLEAENEIKTQSKTEGTKTYDMNY